MTLGIKFGNSVTSATCNSTETPVQVLKDMCKNDNDCCAKSEDWMGFFSLSDILLFKGNQVGS